MPGRFSEHLRLAVWLQVGQDSSGDLSFLFRIGREAGNKCWRSRARVRVRKERAKLMSRPSIPHRPAVTGMLRKESMYIPPRSIFSNTGS